MPIASKRKSLLDRGIELVRVTISSATILVFDLFLMFSKQTRAPATVEKKPGDGNFLSLP